MEPATALFSDVQPPAESTSHADIAIAESHTYLTSRIDEVKANISLIQQDMEVHGLIHIPNSLSHWI